MATEGTGASVSNQSTAKRRLSDSPLFLAAIPAAVSIFAAVFSAISASSAREDADNLLIDGLRAFGCQAVQEECITHSARVCQELADGNAVPAVAPMWNVLPYVVI